MKLSAAAVVLTQSKAALLLSALLCAPACGADATPVREDAGARSAPVTLRWVGTVEDSDVRVAALVGRGKARLFFCGGDGDYASFTRWFDIPFDSEHLEYEDDSWHIHAHLLQGLAGEVQRKGDRARAFNARQFPPTTHTGLYEGRAACGRIGLIVTQASEQEEPSGQGACTSTDGAAEQRVTLSDARGGTIRARTQSGEETSLQPAELDPL